MDPIRHSILIASTSILFSCASWPNEGQGGFAEHHSDNLISVEHNQKLQSKHGLRFDYTLVKNQLSLLKLQGAFFCFPASVDNANQLENRIARELSGGLYDSATTNIVKQRIALTQLEHKLDNVLNQEKCVPPIEPTIASKRQQLLALLNSDNQFPIDSIELNEKYKHNLMRASTQLNQSGFYRLLIVGSADTEGSEHYNLKLSHNRAVAVRKYLLTVGIDDDSMDIIASGKSTPMYQGDSAAVRLVNRNVRIYLIEG